MTEVSPAPSNRTYFGNWSSSLVTLVISLFLLKSYSRPLCLWWLETWFPAEIYARSIYIPFVVLVAFLSFCFGRPNKLRGFFSMFPCKIWLESLLVVLLYACCTSNPSSTLVTRILYVISDRLLSLPQTITLILAYVYMHIHFQSTKLCIFISRGSSVLSCTFVHSSQFVYINMWSLCKKKYICKGEFYRPIKPLQSFPNNDIFHFYINAVSLILNRQLCQNAEGRHLEFFRICICMAT